MLCSNAAQGSDANKPRNINVHNHHVGPQHVGFFYGSMACCSLADNGDVFAE